MQNLTESASGSINRAHGCTGYPDNTATDSGGISPILAAENDFNSISPIPAAENDFNSISPIPAVENDFNSISPILITETDYGNTILAWEKEQLIR